jgi:hypothetical protein
LNHVSSSFFFVFSVSSQLFAWASLDHDSFYPSCIAGMTGMHHHQLVV